MIIKITNLVIGYNGDCFILVLMKLKQLFGKNLHSYRKLRGFSQEQLAERLEISVKHLSTMETGKVFASAELIEHISEELGVSVSSLFFTNEEKSFDDSDYARCEAIIEEELDRTKKILKNRMRTDQNLNKQIEEKN